MDLPSYVSKVSIDASCINQTTSNSLYLPTFPRKLTQAQLYSVNEIAANRKEPDTRISSPNKSNIFAIIHLPGITDQSQTVGISYSGFSNQLLNERKYFGPVSIERLKVSLYDDKGNLVNLHGHNWSFTMIIDELYQY